RLSCERAGSFVESWLCTFAGHAFHVPKLFGCQSYCEMRPSMQMWLRSPLAVVIGASAFVLATLYVVYRVVDPLPPRHLTIAAGIAGSGYHNFAKQYAKILGGYGVTLKIRNSAGAVEDLDLLQDPSSEVQAALTTFGVTLPDNANTLYSLGGIFDSAIYIFYRNPQPITP